jgi:hypothetical protein
MRSVANVKQRGIFLPPEQVETYLANWSVAEQASPHSVLTLPPQAEEARDALITDWTS